MCFIDCIHAAVSFSAERSSYGEALNSDLKHQGRVIIVIYSMMPQGRSEPTGGL